MIAVRRAALIGGHPLLTRIATTLSLRRAVLAETDGDPGRAAVAVVLRVGPSDALELLLIERAERAGDPWSGHIALPGGRRNPQDAGPVATVVRETWEETGIDLARDGVILGALDELRPRTPVLPPIIVTPYVAVVRPDVAIRKSDEVADTFWVPWSRFGDPDVSRESVVRIRGDDRNVPSYVIGRRVVWGMTERILRQLVDALA
jgi:8-oxo-dGTP pyrophosphatase MutT (NUDIX family)